MEDMIQLDDVEYHLTCDDVFKTQKMANKLLGLAKGVVSVKLAGVDGGFDTEIDPVAMLQNMDTPELEAIQKFILNTIQVVKNGESVPFSSESDRSQHFGNYRHHLYQLLIQGGKFHFLPFLPTGQEFAKSMLGQVINKAVANIPK